MKAQVVLLLIILGFSALLSTFEDHLCNDAERPQTMISMNTPDVLGESSPLESTAHSDNEVCHFGHCMHGTRFLFDVSWGVPAEWSPHLVYRSYTARLLVGTTRSSLRPPA